MYNKECRLSPCPPCLKLKSDESLSNFAFNFIVRRYILEVLQWASEHGCCRWYDDVCRYAAQNGHVEVLRWAREPFLILANGPPPGRINGIGTQDVKDRKMAGEKVFFAHPIYKLRSQVLHLGGCPPLALVHLGDPPAQQPNIYRVMTSGSIKTHGM